MEADLFEFESYKSYLKAYIEENRRRGLVSDLAKAAGCDRTYLSQSLNSKVQLTPDHVLGISQYIGLSDNEQNYFLLLNLYERSNSESARKVLDKQMKSIRKQNQLVSEKIKDIIKPSELSDEDKNTYYSSWIYQAIHILSAIEEFQKASSISEKVGLSLSKTQDVLNELESMGLVNKSGNTWKHSRKPIHISRGSAYNTLNHIHWRTKANEQFNNADNIHYTGVFTLSKSDFNKVKKQVLSLIEDQRKAIGESGSEELYIFCCDLYSPF
ncbi:MAG: TIGR02147 family protein [Bdellovibrionales bacterium]|nr:TIGR02147 family protein [Bdellovibrionales bacterium]NQZ19238.1 TIGR02147 family protein [Bdellovibrionales bacterium]